MRQLAFTMHGIDLMLSFHYFFPAMDLYHFAYFLPCNFETLLS